MRCFAYARVFPQAEAIFDIGCHATRLSGVHQGIPWSTTLDLGGASVTAGIARAYSLDLELAERRKIERNSAAGAENELELLVEGMGRALRSARAAGCGDIERLIFVGNGARLNALVTRVERDTGCLVEVASRIPIAHGRYDGDIVAAALPDWALALGAASWSLAAGQLA